MARTGRPKGEVQRDDRLIVRLTNEEHAMIREYARTRNCTITQLVLDSIQALKDKEDPTKDQAKIYAEYMMLSKKLNAIQDILKGEEAAPDK